MARQPTDSHTTHPFTAPAPIPADVGVVAALPVELGFFVDGLKKVRKYQSASSVVLEGELDGRIVAVVHSGAGRRLARAAAELLIAGHRPSLIVSAGFAGGLNPDYARGRVVLPAEVVDCDGGRFLVPPIGSEAGVGPCTGACLLTVDAIARTPAEKAELRAAFGADLVDMETSAVAAACRDLGRRFLAVRVVSDDAATELPSEIASMLNRSTSYQVGAALRAIVRRPSAMKDFWTLHAHAVEASDQLAKALAKIIDHACGTGG